MSFANSFAHRLGGQCVFLRTCEGVHEGGQGACEHLEERVSARILLRSTQHRVLQDVRDPGAVHGGRSELDTEEQEQEQEASHLFIE